MAKDSFYFVKAGKLHFYCPLCHYHQSTNTIQKMGIKHHAQLGVLTVAITVATLPIFGLNSLAFYFIYWAAFEFFYRFRKRQALICESCGFDPFLYMRDVDRARKALRTHWQVKIEKENLFAGIKLKNYQTSPVNKAADSVQDTEKKAENSAVSSSASSSP